MSAYLSVLHALASAFSVVIWPFFITVLILVFVLHHAPRLTDDPPQKEPASMNLFQKANARLNLTPVQRAILQLLENLALAFFVSVLPVLSSALSNSGVIDWRDTLRIALATGAMAVLAAVKKWAKAQGDAPILTAVEQAADWGSAELAAQFGLNEPVVEPDPTPPTDSPASAALPNAA